MADHSFVTRIRAKKLGVLIQSARLNANKSIPECSNFLKIDDMLFEKYEYGEESPSLPQLELLADFFDVPLKYFMGNKILQRINETEDHPDVVKIVGIRQKIIGALIRKTRNDAGMSAEELSMNIGVSQEQLEAYELGEQHLPWPVFESIREALKKSIEDFQDREGPVGVRLFQKQEIEAFLGIPEEMRHFVSKPINLPYLELAKRLSDMPVEKLRSVAEGLLEITL